MIKVSQNATLEQLFLVFINESIKPFLFSYLFNNHQLGEYKKNNFAKYLIAFIKIERPVIVQKSIGLHVIAIVLL